MNLNHPFLFMLLGSINYTCNSCLFIFFLQTSATRDSTISPSNLLQGCAFLTVAKYFPATHLDFDKSRWSPLLCFLYTVEAESRLSPFFARAFWILVTMYTIILLSKTEGLLFAQSFLDLWSFLFSPPGKFQLASMYWKCKNASQLLWHDKLYKMY